MPSVIYLGLEQLGMPHPSQIQATNHFSPRQPRLLPS